MEKIDSLAKKRGGQLKDDSKNKRRKAVCRYQNKPPPQPVLPTNSELQKNQFLRGINNLYGRHYAINAKKEFQFKQQWESRSFYGVEQDTYFQLIHSESFFTYLYTILMLSFYIALFWVFSSFRLLHLQQEDGMLLFFILGIVITATDVAVKLRLKGQAGAQCLDITDLIEYFQKEIIVGVYCAGNIIIHFIVVINGNTILYLADILAFTLIYIRAKTLFQSLKVRLYTSSFKHKMKLIDLLGTLLLSLHAFALLLYCASFYEPNQNWTHKVGEGNLEGLNKYFYSFYFAATTMLTIGYGDLSPTNKVEIMAILPVQVIGVAVFSFIINEIGYTVGAIRKEEEKLEHNLSTLSYMSNFYRMDPQLANMAKEHLISNQKSISKIYPEDESEVLQKLSDDLRQTITTAKGLDIVKSSIFFLCHWTKNFQLEVAKKLIKKVLHPNEMVIQIPGKERIYVVRSGRLDVFTNCSSQYKQQFKRLLKSISPNSTQDISNNVYGYTSVVSSKPVRLAAVSKDFTSVYFLDKEQFLSCVNQKQHDREYFFEIRAKIEESKCSESWQSPAVHDIRQHYSPSQYFILKRFSESLGRNKNHRQTYKRSSRGSRLSKIAMKIEHTINEAHNTEIIIDDCPLSEKTFSNIYNEDIGLEKIDEKSTLMLQFEFGKEYYNFFRANNTSNVLLKYERKNPKISKGNNSKVNMWKYQVSPLKSYQHA